MKKFLRSFESFLENLDDYRDKFLFLFLKPYWPRKITPNHVTCVRLVIGILLFILLFFLRIEDKMLIISLFLIGAITDLIDGPIARGTNQVTALGATLDPLSDRLLVIPIAFYALLKIHPWILLILVIAELINAVVSLYYKTKHTYMESNIFGKTKMVLICIVLIDILIVWPSPLSSFLVILLWATIVLSVLSTISRILDFQHV